MSERRSMISEDWHKALSGRNARGEHKHAFSGDWPVAGYWRMRYPNKDSGMKPVAIVSVQPEDEEGNPVGDEKIEAYVSGARVAPARVWPYCGRFPLSKVEYDEMMAPVLAGAPAAPVVEQQEPQGMQMQSAEIGQIAAALAKAQGAIEAIVKSHEVKTDKYAYTYADLADVADAIRAPLAQSEIAVVQQPAFEDANTVTIITRLIHSSGEWIAGKCSMRATDTRPQNLGSAMTYIRRYSLLSMLNLAVMDDDDDGAAASDERAEVQRFQNPRKDEKVAQANTFANELAGQIDRAKTASFINDLLNDAKNATWLAKLHKDYPQAYQIVENAKARAHKRFTPAENVPA